MQEFLKTLVEERGCHLTDLVAIENRFGITYQALSDFIISMPECHTRIKSSLTQIEANGGDVFEYLHYVASKLTRAMELNDGKA